MVIIPFYGKVMILLIGLALIGVIGYYMFRKNIRKNKRILVNPFPESWRKILNEHVNFYVHLENAQKAVFEKRVQLFMGTKKFEPIDTEIDDSIKIMVAASAIIPMFAFPGYNYPNLRVILIYPNSFDENFQTQRFEGHKEIITGMVGNRFMNGNMIISKHDLISAFDGTNHKNNVAIHEFVHLIDDVDGAIDGIPEILIKHAYVAPWLHIIKEEMSAIEHGRSDINPYALKSNAEFLAVVSEYFFDDPEIFKRKHPDLYTYLTTIFHQNP